MPKDKVTTKIFKLFLRNVASVFYIADSTGTAELVSGFPATSSVYDISKITQFFHHDKSSSISQLVRSKLGDLRKLLGYFNETTTFVLRVLLLIFFFYYYFFILKTSKNLFYTYQQIVLMPLKKLRLYCNRLNAGIKILRTYALYINVLLVFDIHDLNGALASDSRIENSKMFKVI